MTRFGIFGLVVFAAACTKAPVQEGPERPADPPPGLKNPTTPPTTTPPVTTPPATVAKVTVELSAVTLADNCGATPPPTKGSTSPTVKSETKADAKMKGDIDDSKMKMKRRCEVTSMQLIIATAGGGAAAEVKIKTVELFDGNGKSLGPLQPQAPTHWVPSGIYDAWDEKLAPDSKEQVQYVLSAPDLSKVADRYSTTYRLEVTVTVGGGDQKVEKKDLHIAAPTSLPPNVKT